MDPHSSAKGFWYAHVLWLGHLDPRWDWYAGVDQFAPFAPPQVGQDPFYRFLDKFWYCANPIFWIVLYWIGGAPWLFWGGFIAIVFNWHNNHHAFPASANHGFYRWWEFDISYAVIWIMEKLGLVTQVKRVSPKQMESKLKKRPALISVSKPDPSLS
jgi:fatty-acid desaturase